MAVCSGLYLAVGVLVQYEPYTYVMLTVSLIMLKVSEATSNNMAIRASHSTNCLFCWNILSWGFFLSFQATALHCVLMAVMDGKLGFSWSGHTEGRILGGVLICYKPPDTLGPFTLAESWRFSKNIYIVFFFLFKRKNPPYFIIPYRASKVLNLIAVWRICKRLLL